MALPWLQIVQLVPSIVDVSRDLLRRSRNLPAVQEDPPGDSGDGALVQRLAALEENEQRQAELISQMADQIAKLTRAITILHQRIVWLGYGFAVITLIAIAALIVAITR